MAKTIVVSGFGPGISEGVARRFGREGFNVALVARSADKLQAAVKSLSSAGITAKAFPCDVSDVRAVEAMIGDVRGSLGPITVLHWNAYTALAGDVIASGVDDLRKALDVSVSGLVAATQKALPDLKAQQGALLVTGGGFALYGDQVDTLVVQWNAMGLAVSKAAQHKLAGVLHHRLAKEGVYVGELVITGLVKGTAFDQGNATLDPNDIAERFFQMYQARSPATATFGG